MTTPSHLLPHIKIEPVVPAKYCMIWLHGLGADGNDFVSLATELQLPKDKAVRFIFPHAPIMPITINNGYEMRAWYDIRSLTSDANTDQAGIMKSVAVINQLIEQQISDHIESKNILLGGFSQGAALALTTGLRYAHSLGGMIALSGYLPLAQDILKESSLPTTTPIFIAHGTEDTIVPYTLGKLTCTLLKKAGYPITWHSYAMPHSVCMDEIQDMARWLEKILTRF